MLVYLFFIFFNFMKGREGKERSQTEKRKVTMSEQENVASEGGDSIPMETGTRKAYLIGTEELEARLLERAQEIVKEMEKEVEKNTDLGTLFSEGDAVVKWFSQQYEEWTDHVATNLQRKFTKSC